jgi:hypothetical protein
MLLQSDVEQGQHSAKKLLHAGEISEGRLGGVLQFLMILNTSLMLLKYSNQGGDPVSISMTVQPTDQMSAL